MKLRILLALLRKEVVLMRRNPVIPKIIILMPIMVMMVIPLVANLDIRNVNVVAVDNDHTQLSRRILMDADASKEITLKTVCNTHSQAMKYIEDGSADVVLTIPAGFSRDMLTGSSKVDIEANGVNASKGMLGAKYVSQSVAGTLTHWKEDRGMPVHRPELCVTDYFNPTLNFKNYMIPALMVVLLIIICGFIPTLNLVSEKEQGTIEAINVTPVGRVTFVLSKLLPFWIIGVIVVTVGIIIGWLVYGLVPAGDLTLIYLAAVLFSLVMSGLGVTIANRSSTMLQSIFVMFAFIMIFQLMSGLFTPIGSMPGWAQTITYAIPPRYFIEIMRSVYLKGSSFTDLSGQFLILTAFAVVFLMLASLTYRKRT